MSKLVLLTDMWTGERHVVDVTPDPLMNDSAWTTRDGTVVAIADMGSRHIEHTIALLRLRARPLHQKAIRDMMAFSASPLGPSGDMATDFFEAEFDWLVNTRPREWIDTVPVIVAMKAELVRRYEP